MAEDAMSLWRQARPGRVLDDVDAEPGSFRAARFDHERVTPASPNYRSMIPPPPCLACMEDHIPGQPYDHPYQAETNGATVETPAADPPAGIATGQPDQAAAGTLPPQLRVAVYNGRKDDQYVVAVETAPDWDTEQSWKLEADKVLVLLELAHALGVKVSDKTGGDLAAMRSERAG